MSTLGVITVIYATAVAVHRAFAAGEIHETVDHYKIGPSFFITLALVVRVHFGVFLCILFMFFRV